MASMLPLPGFLFKPSDEILLAFYLPKKIAGGRDALLIPSYFICDFDVYSTEPWNLPAWNFLYQNDKKDMHFFSRRHAISNKNCSAKNVKRTAGCGFWNGKGKDKEILCGSQLVGYRTALNFVSTEGGKRTNTNWIMHEFHLKPADNSNKFESMVICRIHLNETKKYSGGHFGSAAIGKQETIIASAATNVQERPLKRKRVVLNAERHPLLLSSVPSSSSSLPDTSAIVPWKEQEALNLMISTLDSNAFAPVTVSEQEEEEVDEERVIELLLIEYNLKNNSKAAAESGNATSVSEQEATPAAKYLQERFQIGKWANECNSMVTEPSFPYLSSSWPSTPALDSFEEPRVHSQFTSDMASFSAAVTEQTEEMVTACYHEPSSQNNWNWDDLDIDVGSSMSYLDELMERLNTP